ncbi:hypothetical protein [uncultured Phascolarctobacterium sp.]|mgnify:FL=1|jgi:hypothetical protein|uniref:hypothetical protein n=1 Tax=uncultured Phascolarctobacterium sp. TaxID=512296 RepID=UPI0025DF26E9|nr:hypothetical protein [uncultured Phascolarctobacterium sp.]
MTIKELYEWAKARNAEDMTLHVDTWNELFNELVVESNLAIAKLGSNTTAVVIRK